MSDSLQPHGLQHARLPYPSPTPGACSNSCPSSWWCHPTISSSVVSFSSCLQSFQLWGLFQSVSSSYQVTKVLELQLRHQSFQWIFLCYWLVWSSYRPRDSQESSPTWRFKSINSLVLSFLYGASFTSIHDYWKNYSFDSTIFVAKVMSLLFNMLSGFVIPVLPWSKHLLISWLQLSSAVILEPKKIKSVNSNH